MIKSQYKLKHKYYSGLKAVPIRLKFMMALGKYFLQRKKYPLFTLKSSAAGLVKTYKTLKELRLCKVIKFNKQYYFSLNVPHWPSEPFNHMVANGGLNITAAGTRLKQHIDIAILAITRKCNYGCKHCYEHFNLADEDVVPIERWKEVVKEIQQKGVSIITFSGGEPMLRYKGLLELLEFGDKSLSDFHIHTSGHEVTKERASELKNAGLNAAAIGLDDVDPDRHDSLRDYKGSYKEALQAIRYFQEVDVFTYVNICLTRDLIHSGDLIKYFELVKDLNVGIIRFLEPRPCGGYLSENMEDLFSNNDKKIITDFFIEANQRKKYRNFPLISYEAYFEEPERMGCMMGGHSHFHIDSLGNVEPCVFLPISFGNIVEENFSDIFQKMRKAIPGPLLKQCPSVYLAEKIRVKKNQGITLPIPYKIIEKEWQQMFERI